MRLGTERTTCLWGTSASRVSSSHKPHRASRLAWQLGQKYLALHGNAKRNSCLQESQRTLVKPCFKMPQARNLSTTSATTDRQYPQRRENRSS